MGKKSDRKCGGSGVWLGSPLLILEAGYRRLPRDKDWQDTDRMNSQDAKDQFSVADAYYRRGRYSEALTLLDELNSAFPNTANILFPRARCMRRLGRTEEALQICDVLTKQFNDKRGAKLQKAIAKDASRPPTEPEEEEPLAINMSLDEILGTPTPPPSPPVVQERAHVSWLTTPVVVVAAVIAAGILIAILAMLT